MKTKKLLSVVLTLCVLLVMGSLAAFAADGAATVGSTTYATLESAIAAATPDASGVITYEISGKAEVTATGWVQVAKAGLSGLKAVKFVGTTEDAEICITGGVAILADEKYDIDVSFEKLTLSKLNPTYAGDYGHGTEYFTCWLRNTGAAENTVTYTDCTFPNGVCNNLYGKTVFDDCKFTNAASGMYNLWNYGGSTEVKNSTFTGVRGIKSYTEGAPETTPTVTVAGTKFTGLTEKPAIVVSKATNVALNDVAADGCTKGLLQKDIENSGETTTIKANGTGISGSFGITAAKGTDAAKEEFNLTGGKFTAAVSSDYCAGGFAPVENGDGTYGVVESAAKGTRDNPYTLAELGAMTRDAYIAAQNTLGGTMYVTVGDYVYDKQGTLGNGKRDDTLHQTEDRSVLNGYNSNGYLGEKNDGANGKTVVFVGGNITSGATGYTSIDSIGTSLLLALPAYTHVQFEGTTFNNVISFDYQLYTGPWSQLGSLEFDGCTFNGLIVGAIASQELRFTNCTFTDYTNTVSANNSNPTWIRPAYGNWSKGDNEGQGDNFRSLTAITFENNKVTSTRPVKFERIAQWEMDTTVTVTGNTFNMSSQTGDTSVKNVGLYLGANAKFDLVAEKNEKIGDTAALYTAVYSTSRGSYAGLPAGSTVKNTAGEDVKLSDAYAWKTTDTIELKTTAEVAEVGGVKFATLAEAVAAAKTGETVTLTADTRENVTIAKSLTLDLNGFTLNGGQVKGTPALTVTARVTVKDSSEAQTGTIMREDTAENSGKGSHYVIDIQGNGWLTFESGNVKNNSGTEDSGKGASLVRVGDDSVAKYPGLNIKGGTFTQDNFIVIKVDRGDLFLNGGTLTSANSYAIENWLRTTIKGGTVNGDVAAWTYSGGANSSIKMSGGTINGNVTAVNYGNAENRAAKIEITGGTVNGNLDTRGYDPKTGELTSIDDAAKATIGITGGTFAKDPTKYVVDDSAITANDDGTFGVAKTYLAKVGETSYYTMSEAQKAQTESGEPLVLLRNYTTADTFNSGYTNRVVDLNGYTWTFTDTDVNDAAFEINYADVTLTVKNGTVVSSSMLGLIPSAMGGTITYDNAGLVFEKIEATAKGHSGIETNGNNTADAVTLKDSTLNVPNGYGIYFPSSGTLTIDNSTINAKTMGVQVCAGSLSINDGSAITVTGDAVAKTENDGAIEDGAAISIVNRTGYKGLGKTTVSGGTFTAKGDAIKAYDWANKTESDFTAEKGTVAVSGGKFSSEVDAALCADGFAPVKNADGTYSVKEETPSIFGKFASITNMNVVTVDGVNYYPIEVYTGIDSLNYKRVGFKYRMVATKTDGTSIDTEGEKSTKTVYTEISGNNSKGEAYTYTAEQFDATYIYGQRFLFDTASFTSAGTKLYITPFAEKLDGTMVYGDEVELSDAALAAYGTTMFRAGN